MLLNLDQPQHLQIGCLGRVHLRTGLYIYLGSAWGPGGLQARINRHLRGQGVLRWHIDYLRQVSRMIGVYTLSGIANVQSIRLECLWSQALAMQSGAYWPASGFGASDCRAGCAAHLVGFEILPPFMPEVLARAAGVSHGQLKYWEIK